MLKITQLAISQRLFNQNKKKFMLTKFTYIYTFYVNLRLKNQNTNGQKSLSNFFDICKIGT